MNEIYPLERVAEAYDRMMSGKARFRVVLTMGHCSLAVLRMKHCHHLHARGDLNHAVQAYYRHP